MEWVEIESCLEARSDGRVGDGSSVGCDKVSEKRKERRERSGNDKRKIMCNSESLI